MGDQLGRIEEPTFTRFSAFAPYGWPRVPHCVDCRGMGPKMG